MKKTLDSILVLIALGGVLLFFQGCGKQGEHVHGLGSDHDHEVPVAQADEHAHRPKYNDVLVEFPGHQYALEIIDEKETTGLVTAFLTDAHFDPIEIDATEVRLTFIVDGSPKSFTLPRVVQEAGKPAMFTLVDKELATLNCEGPHTGATASVEIGGVPYSARLKKLNTHEGHEHAH